LRSIGEKTTPCLSQKALRRGKYRLVSSFLSASIPGNGDDTNTQALFNSLESSAAEDKGGG